MNNFSLRSNDWIPLGWSVKRLGDFEFDISDGNYADKYPTQADFIESGVPFLTANNIKNGRLERTKLRFISEELHSQLTRGHLKAFDILITTRGDLGNTAIVKKEFVGANINAQLVRINTVNKLYSRYLLYFLDFAKTFGALKDLETGTALKQLPVNKLKSLDIVYPDKPNEQRKIARILTTVDTLIEKTEALIKKYESIKQGMMHDLFTRGVDDIDRLRPPYKEAPHLYWESELGWIPRGWEMRTCHSLCSEIIVGIVIRPAQYYVETGVPMLRSANIRENGIDYSNLVYMSEEANRIMSKSMLFEDDLVTVRSGYPGTTCVVPPDLNQTNCIDLIISRPEKEILPTYLSLWINSNFGKGQVLKGQGGLAQQHFNVGEMQKLLVAKPSMDEQKRITRIVNRQTKKMKRERQYLEKMNILKKGLMQDLLTGKVRVKFKPETIQEN